MKILVISICFAVTAVLPQLQPPTPALGKREGDQPQKQAESTQKHAATDQCGTENFPLVVKVLPTPKTEQESAQEKQSRQDQSSANWWMVKLTGIIMLIAALQTFVFGLQARRLRQTVEKMDEIARSQTEDMKASIAQATRSAAAMEKVAADIAVSSKAATESVETLKQRTAQQMRAYITVVIGNAVYQNRANGLRFQVMPVVLNAGATPAYKLSYSMRADILPHTLPQDYQLPPLPQPVGESILGPHQQIILVEGSIVDGFVPDQDVDAIMHLTGERALFAWGVIIYEDIFGQQHQTEFCHRMQWIPSGVFGIYTPGRNRAN